MPRVVDHEDRRAAISDAVVAIVLADGLGAVTFRSVAARIGASTSVVTHYVGSRDELLAVAVRREVARRRSDLEAHLQGRVGTEAVRALVEWCVVGAGWPTQRFWLALVVAAATEPVAREELRVFDAWWDGLVEDLVRAGGAGAEDVQTVVDGVGVLVDGLVVSAVLADRALPEGRRRAVVEAWARALP